MKSSKLLIFCILTMILIVPFSCRKKDPPVVETAAVTSITGTSAVTGGKIISDGGETVVSRGIYWSRNIDPNASDKKTIDGAGAGIFTSNLTKLTPATTYYARAYASTAAGTGYGMVMSFKTYGDTPLSTTVTPNNITTTSAKLFAIINPHYVPTLVSFEYGISASYGSTIVLPDTIKANYDSNVNVNITGLTPGTIYHYRVKAVNSLGTSYGTDMTFTTLGKIPGAVTLAASYINTTTASLSATINPNYLSTTISFEYGTTSSYGSSGIVTQSPITGYYDYNVSASINGLLPHTTYHYRVKTENVLGISYGLDMTFTTLGLEPTVTTLDATAINPTTATLNGTVNPNYLSTTWYFQYGPTVSYGSVIPATPAVLVGTSTTYVVANLTGLIDGTTYHFRVVAVNSLGTSYGLDKSFVASGPAPVSDVDGNVYAVIQIGTQVWFKENLKTTKYNDNSPIPNITVPADWILLTTPSYRWYNDNSSNKNPYGALYNWFAVNTGKLCPTGWHVPSYNDFNVLSSYLGGTYVAGGKIKETGYVHWTTPNQGATNETGFTAMGAGNIDDSGYSSSLSLYSWFWTSTLSGKPYYRSVGYQVGEMGDSNGASPQRGFSIRCLKN